MISPLTLPSFAAHPAIFHGIFNRYGGVSASPFDSLNVSFGVADDPEKVQLNRKKIKRNCGADILVSGRQVHGSSVLVIDKKPGADVEHDGYDAFVSTIPGVGLMVQQADCQAVMLFDPVRLVVANVHCGWRGSVANIIQETLCLMKSRFNCQTPEMYAAISPSLGPCCAEFVHFQQELPLAFHNYQTKPTFFDFWAISRDQLVNEGLMAKNIYTAGICTVCNNDWFSYRREKETGRFCSVIGLKESD